MEVKRPGSDVWEKPEQVGKSLTLADVTGWLVRHPIGDTFIIMRVIGLTPPDAGGVQHLQVETYGD